MCSASLATCVQRVNVVWGCRLSALLLSQTQVSYNNDRKRVIQVNVCADIGWTARWQTTVHRWNVAGFCCRKTLPRLNWWVICLSVGEQRQQQINDNSNSKKRGKKQMKGYPKKVLLKGSCTQKIITSVCVQLNVTIANCSQTIHIKRRTMVVTVVREKEREGQN